jgi:threonine dehydratase
MELVTNADIIDAANRIKGSVLRTPLVRTTLSGGQLWLKPENLQFIGAFKVRGAANVIARLPESARERGVVAYSSGNHAQAVAFAAGQAGIPATIVIDDTAPALKIESTRSFGAEVITVPLQDRQRVAEGLAAERGATLVPPFDHPGIIAGQGTIGLEIMADLPDADVVLVPVSGGGLASGVGVAVKALRPATAVFGVEPELAGDATASVAAGHLVHWPVEERVRTIADGLRAEPSELTFAHLSTVLDGMLTVSEAEIRRAVAALARKGRIVAEPAGAVAAAAALYHADQLPGGKTVAVVSGGNIDPTLFAEILSEVDE